MQAILNVAINAAIQAGKLINQYVDRLDCINIQQKTHNDFVSEVDRQAEEIIIQDIQKFFPDHAIEAEESGLQGKNEYCWIIDPLDGTANFIHGIPQFAVSIAVKHKDTLVAGVVYDPSSHELFTALKGKGARLNNRRLRISQTNQLSKALIGTGFPFRHPDRIDHYIEIFKDMMINSSGIRRAGAAALDLAYVAAGRLDGFWEDGLNSWDIAAGALLIEEAGGMISDFSGEQHFLQNGNLVTGNAKIHKQLLDIIGKHK